MTDVSERPASREGELDALRTLPRGTLVGRYVVLDVIGRGGMGIVYSAYDSQLDRKLALKFLHAEMVGEGSFSEGKARLLREAQAMARLSHPNVVAIHDVGTHGENVFLAMELIDGETLGEWLKTRRNWRQAVAVLRQAGLGLAAAHAAGLVHRDFKPDNVLIGRDGRVTVTDFGVARDERDPRAARPNDPRARPPPPALSAVGDEAIGDAVATPAITLTGSLLGTIGYMAPEQAWEESVDARSDQFSFCATLYFALYGERPYAGYDVATYLQALSGEMRTPNDSRGVPRWLHQVLVKGLAHEPNARFDSMERVLEALGRNPGVSAWRWLAGGGLALAVVATAVAATEHRRSVLAVCEGGRAELSGVWDDGLRERTHGAFVASGAPNAEDTFRRVADRLDTHATAWTTMRTEACVATRVRHQQSEEVQALRMACLDREQTEMRSLTSLFARADLAVVQRALEATYALTSPSWCADVTGLRAAVGLPDNPDLRARVLAVRAEIADVDSLRLSGKPPESITLARAVVARANATPFTPIASEAFAALGAAYDYGGEYASAVAPYKQAAWAGIRSASDAVVARSAARLAFILGDKLFRVDEAEDWSEVASSSLARMGENEAVETDVLAARAVLLVAEGRPEASLKLHPRVIELRTKNLGHEHPLTATAIGNFGYSLQILGRFEEALKLHDDSYAIDLRILGDQHPRIVIDLANLGSTSIGLGQYEAAEKYLEGARALAAHGSPTNFWLAWVLQYSSAVATLRGDPTRGLAYGERALAILDQIGGMQLRAAPGFLVNVAQAHAALGHAEQALGLCVRALPLQERGAMLPERVYEWDALRCIGEAKLALGKPVEALAPLERSVTLVRRVGRADLAKARFALARALVESKGDGKRATALAKEAREALAALPNCAADVGAIDRWSAARAD